MCLKILLSLFSTNINCLKHNTLNNKVTSLISLLSLFSKRTVTNITIKLISITKIPANLLELIATLKI